MESFIKEHFLLNKFLLSMGVGECRSIEAARCAYTNIKSVCCQLKKQGKGEWSVSKKHCVGSTLITRTK